MYTAKYEVKVENKPFSHPVTTAFLRAKFRFSDEVENLRWQEVEANYGVEKLHKYFDVVEKVQLRNNPLLESQPQLYYDTQREITVKPFSLSFGFKVEVTSKQPLPLEQMLNLEALNQFVITGKVEPENEGEK